MVPSYDKKTAGRINKLGKYEENSRCPCFLNVIYTKQLMVVKAFRVDSKILTSKFWFDLGLISKILV